MVTLEIDLSDVLDETHDDDVVVVWPPAHREGSRGQVIAPRKRTIPLVGGKATVEVEPGPLDVQIRAQDGRVDGETRRLTVPEAGPVTLAALFDSAGAFTYAPSIIGQVAQMRDDAEDAAARAEGVADTFGSLEGVADQVQVASDAASSASGSASAAASSASAAATSESNAAGSATSAGSSASSAASAASAAAGGASAAVGAAEAAAGSESQAASSASAAASSASAAASSASAADSAATRAEDVADSTHWQGDRLSVMGQLGPSLKGPKGDKGDPGDGAGDVLWSELDPVLNGKAPVSHDHTALQISDATATGRSVLTAASQAAARGAIGAGTSNLALGTTSSTAKAGNYQPTAANITDATTVGRNVLKAETTAAARTAIGAGTSNLAIGTTASTAKAGNYQPTAANITDATTVGREVLKATDAAAARTAIGAAAVGEVGGAWVLAATVPTNPDPDTLYLIPED